MSLVGKALGVVASGVPWLPWAIAGVAIVAGAGGTLWYRNEYLSLRLANAEAIRKAEEHATALANELVIEQAKAMGVTTRKVTVYVDRIKQAPDDAERNRLGTLGVRDIVSGAAAAPVAAPGKVPAPGPDRGRR